jgi:hypothetical protein
MLRRLLLPVVVVIGLFTPTVAQAAAPYDQAHYSGSDSFTDTVCGLDVTIDVEFSGVVVIRTVKDSDGQAFLELNNYEFTETHTNLATGNQLILSGNGVFHELRGTLVEGTVWAFDALDAGMFTVTDPDGNVLLRDRGVVRLHAIFDTLGDSQPGGVLISEDPPVFHGPHSDDAAFCAVYVDQLT